MNRLARSLQQIASELNRREIGWCLVGGLAVSVYTEPRFTRDIDLALSLSGDDAAEDLVAGLRTLGYETLAIVEQTVTGRLATVRLVAPDENTDGVVIDLLFASSGIEMELVRDARTVRVFSTLEVPVASREHLIALKVLSRDPAQRPQDEADLRALLENCGEEEQQTVRAALRLIAERKCHRGKDLLQEFESVLISAGKKRGEDRS